MAVNLSLLPEVSPLKLEPQDPVPTSPGVHADSHFRVGNTTLALISAEFSLLYLLHMLLHSPLRF